VKKKRKRGKKLIKHTNKQFIQRQNQHNNHGTLSPQSPYGAMGSPMSTWPADSELDNEKQRTTELQQPARN